MGMSLQSNSFEDGDYLSQEFVLSEDYGFGCAGGNQSPHLSWSGAPEGTKSFAVTCYDPDAPTGSGFWHWLVVNLPADATELAAGAGSPGGAMPEGALQTRTDFGVPGWGGPCPPQGDHPHRYVFTVFAVREESLPVNADTSAAVVGFMLNFNTLDKATLMGLYKH
ncbi:MAG: YbhB/YbcL family Raf kinase inhibitor-like protein [Acidimicrobiia bacterium]